MDVVLLETAAEPVVVDTPAGAAACVYYPAEAAGAAVLWISAEHPAHLYTPLAVRLARDGIASLEVFGIPEVAPLLGWLEARGPSRVALVGHGVAGVAALEAASALPAVAAVAVLASRPCHLDIARRLNPRPLLLLHGLDDDRVPDWCSRESYRRAAGPRRLLLYAGCGHDFAECRDVVARDLGNWLCRVLGPSLPFAG